MAVGLGRLPQASQTMILRPHQGFGRRGSVVDIILLMDPHLLSPIAVDSVRRTHSGDEKRMREPAVSFTAERGTRMLGNANRHGESRTSCWLVKRKPTALQRKRCRRQ